MIKRLRIKFICINMAIVTAMLVVIFSLVFFFMAVGMQIQTRNLIQNIAEEALRPAPPALSRRENWRPYFVVWAGSDGEILVTDSGYYEDTDAQQLLCCAREALEAQEDTGVLQEEALQYLKRDLPGGKWIVFMDISPEMTTMENLLRSCILISILSFCAFFGISVLLARWAVKPVERAWNQQRQFVADASHELKTPLTVIMTNAELLQSAEYPEEERRRFADSILTMSHQMRGLVESLLELARVDSGKSKMVFSELDFSELVEESLLPFEPVYFEKDLILESQVQPGIRLRGSGSHLHQVMDILLDNAAKYSLAGGTVTVSLQRQGNGCLLRLSNPGQTISREDLENIFKRFYRIDKARAMNHSYGLGLSIAQSIVQAHGGRIWAQSQGGINSFFVQLPVV